MLEPEYSTQFKRDYRLALRRGFEPEKLEKSSKCSAMSSLYLHNIEIMLW